MAKKKEHFSDESAFMEKVDEPTKEVKEELGRLKVTSNRAYVFSRPDLTSRSLAAVNFGNLLVLLGETEEDFYKVRVPLRGESIVGFIRKTKVKKI